MFSSLPGIGRRPALALAWLLVLCVLTLAGASTAQALSSVQARYLALAEQGVAQAQSHWRDRRHGFYDEHLADHQRFPLATIWGSVPLFESLDAIALAAPSATHRRAVTRFASQAEHYLNRGLHPSGYSPYPGDRAPGTETWFDDNGWLGLAFVNASAATGRGRYLTDAERALRFIAVDGWDPRAGGLWWNTHHPYKAGEALASATLLASLLYERSHSAFALAQARRFLAWGDVHLFDPRAGLYVRSDLAPIPIDYVEGPLIFAHQILCRATGVQTDCARARALVDTSLKRFGSTLSFAPQYDAIYLQWLLAQYGQTGDRRLYDLAASNARAAASQALDGQGLYLRGWTGESLSSALAPPGLLRTHAATTSLFAWLAVYPPPAG